MELVAKFGHFQLFTEEAGIIVKIWSMAREIPDQKSQLVSDRNYEFSYSTQFHENAKLLLQAGRFSINLGKT